MNDKEILTKAIEKAVEGGWKWNMVPDMSALHDDTEFTEIYDSTDMVLTNPDDSYSGPGGSYWTLDYMRLIFSHDFAKAFWGEEWHFNVGDRTNLEDDCNCRHCGGDCGWFKEEPHEYDAVWVHCWQHGLIKMVLEEQPLKYLEKYL